MLELARARRHTDAISRDPGSGPLQQLVGQDLLGRPLSFLRRAWLGAPSSAVVCTLHGPHGYATCGVAVRACPLLLTIVR